MPAAEWELFQLKTKALKCPSCGHKFTLTPKPEKPAPRQGPRERAMKIEIRPGVVLRILAGEATIHCTDLEVGITPADEVRARELLPKATKLREE
jgi:DNA-directed RNA polymerase subunit RPC12/RpoP